MNNFNLHTPTRILFGKGAIAGLREQIPHDARVLITYGGGSVKKTGVLDHKDLKAGFAVNTKENQEVARQAAEESMVLLKNENDFLPLDLDKTKRVVLIGPNCAQRFCILGLGGSSGAQAVYQGKTYTETIP